MLMMMTDAEVGGFIGEPRWRQRGETHKLWRNQDAVAGQLSSLTRDRGPAIVGPLRASGGKVGWES